jgi:tetratricopeptide (TPR) repeat protein
LALEQIEEIEKLYRDQADVLLLKGVAKRQLGQHAEAVELLEPLARQAHGHALVHQELGLALLASGRLTESARALRRSVSLDRRLAESWRGLGEILALEGREEESQAAFRNQLLAIVQHPLLVQAIELVDQGRLGAAEGICREYLLRYPDDVNALRLLAEVGLKLGRYLDAVKLLERCLQLAPEFHLARNAYANALSKSHQFARALQEVEILEQAEPDNLSHTVLAASILVNVGDYEGAIDRYKRALARAPGHARLRLSLGHALKTVGRIEEGIAAYRRAIESEPNLGEAYWSLANLKTFKFRPTDIAAMRRNLERRELDAGDAFHFCFALGKALEDAGEYDESFDYYSAGNELKAKLSGYQADQNQARIQLIQTHCTRELFAHSPGGGHPAPDPIFIVGLPRSGSTLLEQILASHSLVEGTMELPYIGQYAQRLGGKYKNSEQSKYPQILQELTDEQCRALGQEYLDAVQVQRTGRPYFIDKMPNNFAHVGLIHKILPNAKIIDARRHPMACCFSCFKQLFAAGQVFTYGLENIGRYYRDYLTLMDHWNVVLPGKVLLVEYDQVVADFEAQVRRVLEFCGLEFEAACLEFYALKRAVRTPSSEQVRQPIYKDAIEQWRHFETHLGPLKRALGPVLERYPM